MNKITIRIQISNRYILNRYRVHAAYVYQVSKRERDAFTRLRNLNGDWSDLTVDPVAISSGYLS